MDLVLIVLSLVLVTMGAEVLVRGASAVALRLGLSPLFIGLTVVGFGTSTPELGASVVASLQGSSAVALGNVVGSNSFNIFVILGVTAIIAPIRVQLTAVRRDVLVGLAAAGVPFLALLFRGMLPTWLGYFLLLALTVYVTLAYWLARRAGLGETVLAGVEITSTFGLNRRGRLLEKLWVNVLLVLLGLFCLVLGSRFFVSASIHLATEWGISELIIGLTVVSVGTSLPELVTSLVAARRGNVDLAIGNVLGSNIFNVLGILGVSAALRPLVVASQVLLIDVPFMLIGTLALLPILKSDGMISRREGAVLLVAYAVYMVVLIVRAK